MFVNMTELHWVHMEGSTSGEGTLVPREEFLHLLARVDRMLIRAAYHMYQTHTRSVNTVIVAILLLESYLFSLIRTLAFVFLGCWVLALRWRLSLPLVLP